MCAGGLVGKRGVNVLEESAMPYWPHTGEGGVGEVAVHERLPGRHLPGEKDAGIDGKNAQQEPLAVVELGTKPQADSLQRCRCA